MSHNTPASQVAQKEKLNDKSSAERESRGTILERTLHVNITNSLGNLALAGPHGGFWKPVDGTQFKLFGNFEGESIDACTATNQLNCAVIHEVTLLEHQSSFPVPLGVELNCVPPREFTELGQKYSYTVLPCSSNSNPQCIFKAESLNDELYEWHKEFPQYTAANLDTEGVMPVNNQAFVFIDCAHPVVSILRNNAHLIGCDIDQQKRIDGTWYKISKQVLQTCCKTIREKVLSKVATQDLNTLSLQIHRINADGWEDLGDGTLAMRSLKLKAGISQEEEDEAKRKHLRSFTSTPYSYMCRLKVKYELPNVI